MEKLVIGRGRGGQEDGSNPGTGGGGGGTVNEHKEESSQLAPDALAVWSDACRVSGRPTSVRTSPHYLFIYL
jgi:hypothetical protein